MFAWVKQCGGWLKRFFIWIGDARPALAALLALPIVIVLCYGVFSDWEARIRFSGLLLEILGLATVIWGLRDTRKLFNRPSLANLAVEWVGRFPAFYQKHRMVTATADIQLEGVSLSGIAKVSPAANASLDERISLIERKISELNSALTEIQRRIEQEAREQGQALEVERNDRKAQFELLQHLLQGATVEGLHLEAVGVFWLFFGIVLGTASNEISKWFV